MIKRFIEWVDHRTGIRKVAHEAMYENIPCGARFRYVTGSMLVFAFVVQVVTGIFLWMAYSPSSSTAWESVYYIQYQMQGGWLLRGVHHFMAQAMIVVLGLHLLQVIIDGAYRAPREVNYWLGLVLMQLVLGLGLTGYLLPWDQKGYWATNVATNLMTLVPFYGPELQRLALGGSEYGHHTLTRFFAMHAGVLPALLVVFLGMHIALFRRHGIHAKRTPDIVDRLGFLCGRIFRRAEPQAKGDYARPDQTFWPTQVLYDGIGCLVMTIVVLLLVFHFDVVGPFTGDVAVEHYGAELGAPADPSKQFSAARPEWYFLFLFQMLKYFESEFVGAIVVPGAIMFLLVLVPIIGIWKPGHYFNVAFVLALLIGAGVLTGLAINEDWNKPEYIAAKHEADIEADRIKELIAPMLIEDTAVTLLRNDPLTQGPALFQLHCASCHAYRDPQAKGTAMASKESDDAKQRQSESKSESEPTAPNLFGFASREWIAGLLNPAKIDGPEYFGNTSHKDGRMAQWVTQHLGNTNADKNLPADDVDAIVVALSAQARLPAQAEADRQDAADMTRGMHLIQSTCTGHCHKFGDEGQMGLAPDLTGYGSYEWTLGLVSDPTHERFYRSENDRMPSFAKHLDEPATHTVSVRELSLIVDWIRGDYYRASDETPVLPHDPEDAHKAVALARVLPPGMSVAADAGESAQAERLFRLNCAGCHAHVDAFGRGIASTNLSAPNLYGFASRKWLAGLLDPTQIGGPNYFGNTKGHAGGEMTDFVETSFGEDADEEVLQKRQQIIAALSAEAQLPAQKEADAKAEEDGTLEAGRTAIAEYSFENYGSTCIDCHKFHDEGVLGSYPDLTGYGSREWLKQMIANPENERHYADGNDRMPAFGGVDGHAGMLTDEQIDLLARFLRGELK